MKKTPNESRFYSIIKQMVCCCTFLSLLFIISSCGSSKSVHVKKDHYTFAIPSRWQYVQLYDADQRIIGFLSDFTVAMGQKMGFSVKFVVVDPSDIPALFDNGSIDACFSAMPKNSVTQQQYLFTDPLFINGTVVVVGKESPYRTLLSLKGADIGFDNSQSDTITQGADPSWLLRPYDNVLKGLDDVSIGAIDGFIINYMQARLLTKSLFSSHYRILLPPLISHDIGVIVERGKSEELIDIVNIFREEYIHNGEYNELLKYWNIDTPLEEETLVKRTHGS